MAGTISHFSSRSIMRNVSTCLSTANLPLPSPSIPAVHLAKGQVLSDAEIAACSTDDEHDRAYQNALHYLGSRPRSTAEVERHLREKGCADDAIAAAIAAPGRPSLSRRRGVCPLLAGESQPLPAAQRQRPFARSLRQKGVDRETIDRTLKGMDEDDAAWALRRQQA